MASPKLSVSRLVAVSIALTPAGAQAQSLSTLLHLSTTNVIDQFERYREYTSISQVAEDFGTTDGAYKAALLYFGQSPRPRKLMIGKWARTAAPGGLRGAPVASDKADYKGWLNITSGGFQITVDNGAPQAITGLNFSAVASMDQVAAIISAAVTGATVIWKENFKRFEITSNSTGPGSSVSFVTAPGSGSDISDDMKCRSTDGGYTYAGIGAESASAVVNFFDQYYGQKWYALTAGFETDTNRLQFAEAIEAMTNKHIYFTSTTDSAALVAATTTDIASQFKALGYKRTFCQYSSVESYSGGSWIQLSAAAKLLSVDYTAGNTTLTLMYKTEPGVTPELLNESQVAALEAKNCNVYVAYDNDTNILQRGVMSDGTFADIVSGTDWLAVTCQNELWNTLYTSPTKIPQTDEGMHLLVTKVDAVCSQAVRNGLLAPGIWNSQGFGTLKEGDLLATGFYVYAPRVDTQLQSDRAARKAVPIQVAAKLAGAIHEVSLAITVNQ